MTFSADIDRFLAKLEQQRRDLFVGVATETLRSIQEGSPLTGAPGQPVDTGYLKSSWQLVFEGPMVAQIMTNVAYAPVIEENLRTAYDPRGVQPERPKLPGGGGRTPIKSTVGGHHSVRLTRAGFQRIVAAVAQEVTA